MAKDKKGFVLYADLIHTVRKMPRELQSDLFMTILEYVNDENPEPTDLTIELVFEGIKQQLKRDLKKYEARAERARANGAKGGRPKNPKKPNGLQNNPTEPKKPDTVNVTVTDTVKEINSLYSESEFLKDWNELRHKHLNKPSNRNRIGHYTAVNAFNQIKGSYTRDQFRNALIGLFKQQILPNGNEVMQSDPKHFLEYFERYLTAYEEKNDRLYGQKKKESLL